MIDGFVYQQFEEFEYTAPLRVYIWFEKKSHPDK